MTVHQQRDNVYNVSDENDNDEEGGLLKQPCTLYHHHYRKENKTKKKNLHINSHATAHTDTVGKFDNDEDDKSFDYFAFIDHDAFEDIFGDAKDDKFRNYDRMEEEQKKMEEERQEEEEQKKMEADQKKMEEARRLEE